MFDPIDAKLHSAGVPDGRDTGKHLVCVSLKNNLRRFDGTSEPPKYNRCIALVPPMSAGHPIVPPLFVPRKYYWPAFLDNQLETKEFPTPISTRGPWLVM